MGYWIEYIDGFKVQHPNILYKYRDWNNDLHKKILKENKLYLASPKDFEDIYDCNIPERFPQKEELYNFFLDKAKTESPLWTRQERRKYARYWSKKSPLGNPKLLSNLISEFNQEFNKRFGVLSMTADNDNDEMWYKYANNHQGICIGFDTKQLFNCIGGGGEVQYVEKLPIIDFVKDDFKSKHIKNIFFKEDKWSFEKEYRLHKMWSVDVTNDERNISLPSSCIMEIILGKYISEESEKEIIEIVRENYPNIKIIKR